MDGARKLHLRLEHRCPVIVITVVERFVIPAQRGRYERLVLVVHGDRELRLTQSQERQPGFRHHIERKRKLLGPLSARDGIPRHGSERERFVVHEAGGGDAEWASIIDIRDQGILTVKHQPLIHVVMLLQHQAALDAEFVKRLPKWHVHYRQTDKRLDAAGLQFDFVTAFFGQPGDGIAERNAIELQRDALRGEEGGPLDVSDQGGHPLPHLRIAVTGGLL